jgi:zinc transport system substrate-binding protein
MNKQYIVGLVLVAVLGSAAFAYFHTKPVETAHTNKMQVVASFYPMYFFASQIGGEKVQVSNITPSGAEPHDFEPSTQDVAKIQSAKLLVLNGSVEAWGPKIQEQLKGTPTLVVIAGQGLTTKQLAENGAVMSDPHVWLDPVLAKQEVHAIALALAKVDPTNEGYYLTNEAALDAKLDETDAQYHAGLNQCVKKDIITSHAAFAYLSERYGLTQVPIDGLSPDAEPSPAQLADVVKFAKAHGVTYIFFESLVSPKLSQTIASEVGAKTVVLDPIEGISDQDQAAGQDYFSVMSNNLKSLQTALKCPN